MMDGSLVARMMRSLAPGFETNRERTARLPNPQNQAFTGPSNLRQAFDNVKRAIRETFAARGMDYAFGLALPGLVGERAAKLLSMEYDCPVTSGGTNLAQMMRLSTLSLGDKYVATGFATAADIAGYAEFAVTANCWGNYSATVRILAQKSRSVEVWIKMRCELRSRWNLCGGTADDACRINLRGSEIVAASFRAASIVRRWWCEPCRRR